MTRAKRWLTVTAGLAAGLGLGACNGQIAIGGAASDGGLPGVDAVAEDTTTTFPTDATQTADTRAQPGTDAPASGGDGPSQADSGPVVLDAASGSPVDAGYYYGDGAYFVDGGAYPDTQVAPTDAPSDSATALGDAAPGCAALAACCGSLPPANQSLCSTVVGLGNAASCAAELGQLQGAGDCTGVSVLASDVQLPPNVLVSDGALLFWTTTSTPALLSMPVGGGPIRILLTGPITNRWAGAFLAVDGSNVYVLQNDALVRIPKAGGGATLVNEPGAILSSVTSLGGNAYWVESSSAGQTVMSAPLLGGSISALATFQSQGAEQIAVTTNAFFFTASSNGGGVSYFTSSGQAGGGPEAGTGCGLLTSDNDAVYCSESAGSNLRLTSDGGVTTLGTAIDSSYITVDDTSVYWADLTNVGSILKAPKSGGAATVLAWDTAPTAIAVDARAVYWGDMGGFIKSVPK